MGVTRLGRMNDWAATHVTNQRWFERLFRVMFWHIELVDRGLRASAWPRAVGWFAAAVAWATGLILLLALPIVILAIEVASR